MRVDEVCIIVKIIFRSEQIYFCRTKALKIGGYSLPRTGLFHFDIHFHRKASVLEVGAKSGRTRELLDPLLFNTVVFITNICNQSSIKKVNCDFMVVILVL